LSVESVHDVPTKLLLLPTGKFLEETFQGQVGHMF